METTYIDRPEQLVTRADFEHANGENKRNGHGTLNSESEFWHAVAVRQSVTLALLRIALRRVAAYCRLLARTAAERDSELRGQIKYWREEADRLRRALEEAWK